MDKTTTNNNKISTFFIIYILWNIINLIVNLSLLISSSHMVTWNSNFKEFPSLNLTNKLHFFIDMQFNMIGIDLKFENFSKHHRNNGFKSQSEFVSNKLNVIKRNKYNILENLLLKWEIEHPYPLTSDREASSQLAVPGSQSAVSLMKNTI